MNDYFKDKVVIVTGASSGIGESIARTVAKRGAKVVLSARRKEKLEWLSAELKNSLAVYTDVTQEESVHRLVEQTVGRYGRIDILINNAGILLYKPIMESSFNEVREVMETNFFGAVLCAHSVIPIMKRQKEGAIVNVASIAGRIGFTSLGYYGASKFALVGFSESLRQELAPEGIFVSLVCPGVVNTPMSKAILDEAIARGKKVMPISPERVAEKILLAIEKKKAEVFVPSSTHFFYWLHFFFRRFSEWLAFKFRASDPPPHPPAICTQLMK